MKTKAFSDTRFPLGHRDYSERNTQKEDITDHTNKPVILACQRSLEVLPFNQLKERRLLHSTKQF